jgi:hypothetical protein
MMTSPSHAQSNSTQPTTSNQTPDVAIDHSSDQQSPDIAIEHSANFATHGSDQSPDVTVDLSPSIATDESPGIATDGQFANVTTHGSTDQHNNVDAQCPVSPISTITNPCYSPESQERTRFRSMILTSAIAMFDEIHSDPSMEMSITQHQEPPQ